MRATARGLIKNFQIRGDNHHTHLQVHIYHSNGGLNLLTYKDNPVGNCISIKMIEIQDIGDRFVSENYTGFSGRAKQIDKAARLSRKKLQTYMDEVITSLDLKRGDLYEFIRDYCTENSAEIA